jgi:CHAT domain-containing protein
MVLDTSFLLIEADWPVARARRLAEGLASGWIVIHRVYNGEDLYYPFARAAASLMLSALAPLSVREAFNLHETDAGPTAASDVAAGDRTVVIVSRGQVRGIVPAQERTRSFEVSEAAVPGAPVTVERAIEATAPSEVALNDAVSLVVKLVMQTSEGASIPVHAAVGESLDVVIQTSGGLRVQGKNDGTLKVAAAGTPMLLFKIEGKTVGPGEVSVMVFQRGESVGSLDLAIRTVANAGAADSTSATALLQSPSVAQPDLMLLVVEPMAGTYTMYLTATDPNLQLNFTSFSFSLQQDPRTFFDTFYTDIEAILTSSATPQQKIQRLGTKGTYLFEQLLSPQARVAFWAVRSRIRSVHIQSQEPWVPWELLKPSGDDGTGNIAEAGFLCEDYEVTRWVPGLAYRHDLTMTNVGVVTPPDSGLPAAIPERDQMMSLASPTRQVTAIQAEEVALRQALAGGGLDVIHFTGHGIAGATSADRSEIRLQSGSRLRPEDLTGVVANLGTRKPIVFLNACEIGRAGMGLTRPGGWPRGFLAVGAGAFIGPFWKVADASAATFAAEFYDNLIAGKSVGAAAHDARMAIQVASDPSWLAYSVYAHCDARLT